MGQRHAAAYQSTILNSVDYCLDRGGHHKQMQIKKSTALLRLPHKAEAEMAVAVDRRVLGAIRRA